MALKLRIGDQVEVPIHLKIKDGGKLQEFKFAVTAKRLNSDQARDIFTEGTETHGKTIPEFLHENLTGWRGQTLVLDESDEPAPYGVDALDAMLGVTGAASVIYTAYLNELLATDGAAGRRKN